MTVDNQNNESNNSHDETTAADKLAQMQASQDFATTADSADNLVEAAANQSAGQPATEAAASTPATEAEKIADMQAAQDFATASSPAAEVEAAPADDSKADGDAEQANDAKLEAVKQAEDADTHGTVKVEDDETDGDATAQADDAKSDAKNDDAEQSAEAKPEDARDPRIPEVITARTLFFLAPDLPPLPEAPRGRRNDNADHGRNRNDNNRNDSDDDRNDDNSGDDRSGRRRSSRRGRRGSDSQRDSGRRDQHESRTDAAEDDEVIDEPQAVKGSTRLAAKRQRRRESRELGRRRTVVTESEFQARRESVDRKMLVRAKDNRVQIGVLEDDVLVEHYVARNEDVSLIGNVYLGRVQNVLPSMEAAFVDIGAARNAVLYSGEVDWSAAELGPNTARKIENALKPGDKVLVQVTKDPVGHKGARLTSQISLPGRYLVYVPGNTLNGISRKLPESERSRLKKILKEVLPEGVGVIVRTAAEGATEEQLGRDVERLTKQWDDIQKQVASAGKGAKTLHAEPDVLIKIIRDVFNEDFHKLIIEGSSELNTIKSYLGQVAPDLLERVEAFTGDDIFTEYRVNEMIDKALGRKVWLPSGGSLVIDRTEAMTVIDVNTGKFVGSGGNLEETVTKNNLEAAEEIIRQLRLRDIGGIIVIDFIDMVLESNRDLVHRRLVEGLSRDRTKHQVAEVTSLGLVQMTRKKIGLGLLETFSEPCAACAGRGVVVHSHPVNHGGGSNNNSKGRSSSRRGNKQQNDNSGNKNQKSNGNGTHEITDDARNALTKIAASTMVVAKDDDSAQEAAQKLADAAAAAASGKPAAEVLAAAGESSNDSSDEREGRRSRRSRRGGRGRNKGGDGNSESTESSSEEQDSKAADSNQQQGDKQQAEKQRSGAQRDAASGSKREQDAPANSRRASASAKGEAQADAAPEAEPAERKPRRRRVSTGTVTADATASESRRESARSIELPEAKTPAPAQEPKADASVTLASLDAALDSLAGVDATPEPQVDEPATKAPEPVVTTEAPEASTPKRRRRITTGPISTD